MKDGIYHLSDLFEGNRIFSIPDYQRNYAWEDKHLEDFYNDLFYIDGEKEYFIGTILLRETGEKRKEVSGFREFKVYEVIDGQQRLTTICIFIKSAIEILKSKNEESLKDYIEDLKGTFIVKSVFLRLELLGEDKRFFKNYIIEGQEYPDETITPSQKRLKKAKIFFKERLGDLSIDDIKNLLSKLTRTRVLVYTVKEKGDAMLMFETINDRGKPLSNLEKTKSFLMYLIYTSSGSIELTQDELLKLHDKKRQQIVENKEMMKRLLGLIDEKFGRIYRYIETINEKYSKDVQEDDIQRYHWALWFDGNYKESFKYIDKLKIHFRNLMLNDRDKLLNQVENYVISLEQVFYAFKEVFVDKINEFDELKYIVSLGRVGNFYPLIISTWIKEENEAEFKKILVVVEKFIFRVFLIGNKRSDTGVSSSYNLAHEIFKNNKDMKEALSEIKDNALSYVSEIDLINELNNENFYNRHSSQDIRYIFYHYESMLREKEGEPLSINLEEILGKEYTIEHILARYLSKEHRPEDLKDDEEFEKYIHRLGNLVLCSKSWNSRYGNKPFEEKKKCRGEEYSCYQKSIFKCQQKLAEFETFSKTEIDKRQQELIKWIKERRSFRDVA